MTSAMHARKAKLKNHLVSAKERIRQHVTPRRVLLLAAAACSASLLLVILRTLHSAAARGAAAREAVASSGAASTPSAAVAVDLHPPQQKRECATVPAAVREALVHYATSSETPQQLTEAEASAAASVLARRAPCNLLVFGLGADSALWAALNHGGRTVFLDADADRIASFRAARPAGLDLEAHQVAYQQDHAADDGELLALRDSPDCTGPAAASSSLTTKHLSPDDLERSPCKLAPRGLPAAFYDAEWDVIMVSAPPVAGAIYTAGITARAQRLPGKTGETTDVLVLGVGTPAEDRFSRAFLCEGHLKEEAGRTRHFVVPSHRAMEAMPFCP